MIETPWLILGLILPALLAAAALVTALQPGREGAGPRGVALGWTLAITAGFLLGLAATFGPPVLTQPPTLASYRWQDALFALILLTGCLAFLGHLVRWMRWITWPLIVTILVAAPLVLLWPIARNEPAPPPETGWNFGFSGILPVLEGFAEFDPRRWLPMLALGLLALVLGGGAIAHGRPGRDLAPAWGLAAVAVGITLALSDSLSIGKLGLALGGLAAGGGFIALLARRDIASAGLAVPLLFVYGCVLILGYFYTYDPYASDPASREGLTRHHALTLAAAPLLGGLASLPLPKFLDRPWLRATFRLLLTLIPVIIVVILAKLRFDAAAAASEYAM